MCIVRVPGSMWLMESMHAPHMKHLCYKTTSLHRPVPQPLLQDHLSTQTSPTTSATRPPLYTDQPLLHGHPPKTTSPTSQCNSTTHKAPLTQSHTVTLPHTHSAFSSRDCNWLMKEHHYRCDYQSISIKQQSISGHRQTLCRGC